jgi:hypothetical protein
MTQSARPGESATGSRVPDALGEPLRQFFFETHTWVRPRALAQMVGGAALPVEEGRAVDAGWRRAVAQLLPPRKLDTDLLCHDLRGRLALLSRADWLRLGLCVGVLSSCGQIQRSMDGHFRRVVRQLLEEEAIQRLDQGVDVPAQKPVFLAGPGAWRAPEPLALAGVRAAMAQACPWPDAVASRVRLHFEPEELEGAHSVSGLDMRWLEIACKALWPDHPWLWS